MEMGRTKGEKESKRARSINKQRNIQLTISVAVQKTKEMKSSTNKRLTYLSNWLMDLNTKGKTDGQT